MEINSNKNKAAKKSRSTHKEKMFLDIMDELNMHVYK